MGQHAEILLVQEFREDPPHHAFFLVQADGLRRVGVQFAGDPAVAPFGEGEGGCVVALVC